VLLDLGIFPNHSWEEIREKQLYKKYYPHKVAHFLGLDVHDLRSDYTLRMPLVKNMVLTIEPGLYFPVDDLQIPKEFRGVGVRIEDDLLITESGIEILTR
jgi:Xaa-Pro aminopeptidase